MCVRVRLLGLVFDDKLSWWALVRDMAGRARTKLWALVRLRNAGAGPQVLLVNYCSKIRTILEYGAQVWGTFINGAQAKCIEDCQLHALQIILGAQTSSYNVNLAHLEVDRLSTRRDNLILKFAISTF